MCMYNAQGLPPAWSSTISRFVVPGLKNLSIWAAILSPSYILDVKIILGYIDKHLERVFRRGRGQRTRPSEYPAALASQSNYLLLVVFGSFKDTQNSKPINGIVCGGP